MSRLDAGQIAPDFTLPSDDGGDVTLSTLRGQIVVALLLSQRRHERLHRPGVELRERGDEFAAADARVLGVSPIR